MTVSSKEYNRSVFINCPFDIQYAAIFEAVVFAIIECGFEPTCARQRLNSGQVRIEMITSLIRDARYSIHDLSRTESSARTFLPRFNMPLELGIALGCARVGPGRQRQKTLLILDRRRYRYHKFVSDISGQDISEHGDRPERAVEMVRNWLRVESGLVDIPGHTFILRRYRQFRDALPAISRINHLNVQKLTYADYCFTIREWLRENAP